MYISINPKQLKVIFIKFQRSKWKQYFSFYNEFHFHGLTLLRRFSFRSLMSTCMRIVTSAWLFNPDQCGSTVALLWLYREISSDILDCLPQMIISTTTVCSKKYMDKFKLKYPVIVSYTEGCQICPLHSTQQPCSISSCKKQNKTKSLCVFNVALFL